MLEEAAAGAAPVSDTLAGCSGTAGSFFLAVPEIAPGSVFTESDSLPSPVPAGRMGLLAEQMRWCFTHASSLQHER